MEFKSDYYYGKEANQYIFYRIPKMLFTEPYFCKMSNDSKILYGLMLDRMGISGKNNWRDENNRIFIYFTLEDIQKYLNCSHTKGVKLTAELENMNLIESVKQGQGKPTRIYIKKFFTSANKTYQQKFTDYPQSYPQESQNFTKQEMQTCENEKSGLPKIGSTDISKTDTNNNNYNNNEFNNIECNKSKSMSCHNEITDYDYDNDLKHNNSDNIDEYPLNKFVNKHKKQQQFENFVKEQINYNLLISNNPEEKTEVDSLVFMITETLLSNSQTIRINGENKTLSIVKSVFSKIDYGIIRYTINKFKEQKHKIKHIKSYLLTCLYNARAESVYNGINYLSSMGYNLPQSS